MKAGNYNGKSGAAKLGEGFSRIFPWPEEGFTLIELLVVIAIIGILAAMLFPALSRAQGMQCLGNLRQVSLGWQLYTDDSGGRYPVNASTGGIHRAVGEDTVNPSWVAGLISQTPSPDNTNTTKLVGGAYLPFGSIGGYVKNPGVYHCPGDTSIDPGNGRLRVRSISMNGWGNPGQVNPPDSEYWTLPFQKFTGPAAIHGMSPSDLFVFLDERAASINDGWLYECMDGYNSDGSINENLLNTYDLPAIYHNKCSAFSLADGHAKLHRWLGFPEMSDNDIVWLMTHASTPQPN